MSVCGRSMFNLRVRSIWRSSSTSAPAAKVEACPWSPALPVRPTRWISLPPFLDIVVNDMGDVIHVQTTCCNIGRHEDLETAFLKPTQSSISLILGAIAMNHGSREALAHKFLRRSLGALLGPCEDQRLSLFCIE